MAKGKASKNNPTVRNGQKNSQAPTDVLPRYRGGSTFTPRELRRKGRRK